jgi:hypothetical protein
MNFDKPPVGPSSYEPMQITNIANETTEKLTELLGKWKKIAENKGGDSGIKKKIDLIEKELGNRQNK